MTVTRPFAFSLVLLVFVAGGLPTAADATLFTLTHRNSLVQIDDASPNGMYTWSVDGVDHMYQQWFWYRVGNSPEASIDTLNHVSSTPFFGTRGLAVVFSDPGGRFTIEVDYKITGGSIGSNSATVDESISITNLSSTDPLDFHVFQYTDFNLNGTPEGDTAERVNANTIRQAEAGVEFSELVVTPPASHYQVDLYPTILNALNDSSPTTLTDFGGPITGNVAFAWQWDTTVGPSGSFLISKAKRLAPLPSASSSSPASSPSPIALVVLGLGILGVGRFAVGTFGRDKTP